MDTGYLLMALRAARDAVKPWQYQEALDWIINHVDANYYHFEELLDDEREGGTCGGYRSYEPDGYCERCGQSPHAH